MKQTQVDLSASHSQSNAVSATGSTDARAPRKSMASKLLKKLHRELSMPVYPSVHDTSKRPKLYQKRSGDYPTSNRRGDVDLRSPPTRSGGTLFAGTARRRPGVENSVDDVLKAIRSEESQLSDEEAVEGSTSQHMSEQLSKLWGEGPHSKTCLFKNLLNIENAA
jgi:hypothetical protein